MAPVTKEMTLEDRRRPSIKVTKRAHRSLYMFILQHLIKPFNASLVKPREEIPAGSQKLEPHKKARKRCDVYERQVEGIYIYDMVAKHTVASRATEKRRARRIYYFAGGG